MGIQGWSEDGRAGRRWTVAVAAPGPIPEQTVALLVPQTDYRLSCDGVARGVLRSDAGKLTLRPEVAGAGEHSFELRPAAAGEIE